MWVSKELFIQGADAGLEYVLHVALLMPLSLLEYLHRCQIVTYYVTSQLLFCDMVMIICTHNSKR